MKLTILLILTLFFPLSSFAATFYAKAIPEILVGIYEKLVRTELKFMVDGNMVKICGLNIFRDGRKAPISKRWSILGNNLYNGREKVGTFQNNQVYVERFYSVNGESQKQITVLILNETNKTMLYALKDSYVGGYEVIGPIDRNPSNDLVNACPE